MVKWLRIIFTSKFPDQSTSFDGTSKFEVTTLGDGVRTSDLEDLKASAPKCLTDGLFKKLLDLEEVGTQFTICLFTNEPCTIRVASI